MVGHRQTAAESAPHASGTAHDEPDAVRSPAYRDAKLRTLLETAEEVLGPSAQAPVLRLADDEGQEHSELAVVLVSNNPYALEHALARGTRPALDTGQLGIVILALPGRHPPGRAWTAPRLEVNAPAPVHSGIDGEPADLSPPLRFTIRPAELRVRISPRHPGASPSARFPLPAARAPAGNRRPEHRRPRPWRRLPAHRSPPASHRANQAGRPELKINRYSPEPPITQLTGAAAAA